MTGLRPLLAAWIAALTALLALAGTAGAATNISSSPIDAWSAGQGQFNAEHDNVNSVGGSNSRFFYDPADFESAGKADNGLNIAVYDWNGGSTPKVFGFRGTPFTTTSVPDTNGTTNPIVLTSKYTTGDCLAVTTCLEVTETEQYVPGSHSILVTYDVKNLSAGAVRYRLTAGGDVYVGGVEGGNGRHLTSGGEWVGTINHDRGAAMDIQLAGGPAWDDYMEGVPFNIWRKVQDPDGTGLDDSVVSTFGSDKAAAVEWNNHATIGNELGAGLTESYQLRWRYLDFASLTIGDPPDPETHTAVHVSASGFQEDGTTPTSFATSPLYWRTTPSSSNPQNGGNWTQINTGISADITYTGDTAGSDGLEFWVDIDNDGIKESGEPFRTRTIFWFNRVAIKYPDASQAYVGYQNYVHLRTLNGSGFNEARDFRYFVVDKATSTTRIAMTPTPPGTLTTTAGTGDYLVNQGIPLTRDTAGTDVVHVVTDYYGNGTFGDQQGEEATYEIRWLNRVETTSNTTAYTDDVGYLYAYGYTSDGDETADDMGYWVTDPDAVDPNAAISTQAPVAPDFGEVYWNLDPADVGLTPTTGGTRIYHVYIDEDASGDYTAGEPVNLSTVDWLIYPNKRVSFAASSGVGTIGFPKTLTATLRKANGDPQSGIHLRYTVAGKNPVSNVDAGTTNGSGQLAIPFNSALAGFDDITAYADLNGNAVKDSGEPQDFDEISWGPAIRISTFDVAVPDQGDAFVSYYNQNGDPVSTGLITGCSYSVTGAHPVGSTACATPSSITWPGAPTSVTGTDTLTVNATIPGVGATSAQKTIKFTDQLELFPTQQTKTVGQTAFISPSINHATFARNYHWVVSSGPNAGLSGDVAAGDDIEYVGTASGIDTVTVSTTSPSVQSTATVDWKPEELTLTGTGDGTQGAIKTVTATLRDPVTGAPLQDKTLRWTMSGPDALTGKNAATTDAGGQVEISFPTADDNDSFSNFDSITVYADLDDNAVKDSNEPQKAATIEMHPPLEPDDTSHFGYQGGQKTVTVTYRNLAFNPIQSRQLKYMVVDRSVSLLAGNPVPATNMPQPTDSNGQASITLTGTNTGYDRLKIWDDTTGPTPNVIDPGEKVAVTDIEWDSRVYMSPSGTSNRPVSNGPLTISGEAYTLTGSPLTNTALKYTITGLHDSNGVQTVTTNGFGDYTLPQVPATDGGQDVVTVWLDLNSDGDVDAGESKATLTLNWTGATAVNTYTQTLFQNGTHSTITFSGTGITPTTGSLAIAYNGPNVSSRGVVTQQTNWNGSSVNVPAITGGLPGTDYIHAWWDKDNDKIQDSGEPGTSSWITWKPLVTFGNPSGSLIAGNATTVTATLLDTTGTGVSGASDMKFKVAGNNTLAPAAVPGSTNGSGNIDVTYTGTEVGTDTVTVWRDLNSNSAIDPGEPQGTKTIHWTAPPVTLVSAPTSDKKFQGNQSNFVLTLAGMPGGNNGRTIRWETTGVNATSSTATTNGAGQVTIQWTGTNDGKDTLSAYADVSGSPGVRDGYDPVLSAVEMTWDPLVRISGGASDETTGASHTETINFVDELGNPLADTQVIYSITGANPTAGQVIARPISAGAGSRILKRTDSNGNANITWTGTNAGTDTLDVWADRNGNGIVDGAEPHAQKVVTFAGAAAAGAGGGAPTGPVANPSQVPPGSINDFDGVAIPPPPVVAKAVNVAPVSGRVLVKLPGSSRFIELLDAEQIPVGSIVDVSKGRVALTSAQNLTGGVATAQFYLGVFQIGQKKAAKPVTDLAIVGGNFKPCATISKKSKRSAGAAAAKPKKKIRQLWGNGKGLFRTKGKYAAAAIRGTTWAVIDYCNGTLVKVTQGAVTVTDQVKKKNVVVKAPKSYFAEAKPAKAGKKRR